MKKLPIGLSTLADIIQEDYLYIDKTKLALDLINEGRYYFLSRPRRFGKSLFLDTLRTIFEGRKELFKGLHIYERYEFVKYPVIRISFNDGRFSTKEGLQSKIFNILKENQRALGVVCVEDHDTSFCFRELIIKTYEKYNQKVVILIDEYDKPILDNIEDPEVAKKVRDGLVNFYSVIKGSDEFLRFAFLTGVSKFTKTSIFSGLNNIVDITLQKKFGDICGYSQNDIETSFAPYLESVDMQKLKSWYNGYNFLGSSMYNPFDILQFIANEFEYKNYWFETGTPTFLMKLIAKNNYFLPSLSNLKVDEKLLNSFDIENLDLEVILYQSGYLTIDTVETTIFETLQYNLKIPNKEVKQSLNDYIIDYMFKDKHAIDKKTNVYKSLLQGDMQSFKSSLISIFASIPYNHYTKNNIQIYEGFYASVIYVYLQSLGLTIIGEDVTNEGRIDLTILMDQAIYILEFKIEGKGNALVQIKENNYASKYLNHKKDIYLIGIEFDTKEKNIGGFEWEKM